MFNHSSCKYFRLVLIFYFKTLNNIFRGFYNDSVSEIVIMALILATGYL